MPQPYSIHLRVDNAYKNLISARLVRATARTALAHQAAPTPGELSIRLTTDEALRDLNRTYLGHDYATDVLSFPAEDHDPDTGRRYFGDLALSIPRAQHQAQIGGHPVEAEVQLLIVHGVLHLLGHDHMGKRDQQRMWAAQAAILQQLGALIHGPTEA